MKVNAISAQKIEGLYLMMMMLVTNSQFCPCGLLG